MTVSNALVGRVIGRSGSKINSIQEVSGAHITVSRNIPKSTERLVTIKVQNVSVEYVVYLMSSVELVTECQCRVVDRMSVSHISCCAGYTALCVQSTGADYGGSQHTRPGQQ